MACKTAGRGENHKNRSRISHGQETKWEIPAYCTSVARSRSRPGDVKTEPPLFRMNARPPQFRSHRPAFWIRPLIACMGISIACASIVAQTPSSTTKQFPQPQIIRYDGHCLTIDGTDTFIRSAAFHYFRTPRELWRDRFQKIKDAGFNTVETYVPWNWHEREIPSSLSDFSKVDFSECRSVAEDGAG